MARPQMRLLLLGAPGAGKGTQASRLMNKWHVDNVGVGDVLRREIEQGTQLGREAQAVMKAGSLLPDETVLKLVEPRLLALRGQSWILDGFPRKASQAALFDSHLCSSGSALDSARDSINLVVELQVPDRVILKRIEDRWIHPGSNRSYNMSFNPPKVAGQDDVTGEPLAKRPDDTREVFEKRLKAYHELNDPLVAYYRRNFSQASPSSSGPALVSLAGETSDIIWPQLEECVRERFGEVLKPR